MPVSSTDRLQITLARATPSESGTREAVLNLAARYDLEDWMFTRSIHVDQAARPHSHPVLTLNAQHQDDEIQLLAAFVHEQLHWFEELHAAKRDAAIEASSRDYPVVPIELPEGAGSEYSTRLHLIVCYLEYEVLKRLLGPERAREAIVTLSRDHYCWVYRTVLEDQHTLSVLVRAFDLLPDALRDDAPSSAWPV